MIGLLPRLPQETADFFDALLALPAGKSRTWRRLPPELAAQLAREPSGRATLNLGDRLVQLTGRSDGVQAHWVPRAGLDLASVPTGDWGALIERLIERQPRQMSIGLDGGLWPLPFVDDLEILPLSDSVHEIALGDGRRVRIVESARDKGWRVFWWGQSEAAAWPKLIEQLVVAMGAADTTAATILWQKDAIAGRLSHVNAERIGPSTWRVEAQSGCVVIEDQPLNWVIRAEPGCGALAPLSARSDSAQMVSAAKPDPSAAHQRRWSDIIGEVHASPAGVEVVALKSQVEPLPQNVEDIQGLDSNNLGSYATTAASPGQLRSIWLDQRRPEEKWLIGADGLPLTLTTPEGKEGPQPFWLHIREFDDRYMVHWDYHDPRHSPGGHLLHNTPRFALGLASGLGAATAAIIGAATGKSPSAAALIGALVGLALGGVAIGEKGRERLIVDLKQGRLIEG